MIEQGESWSLRQRTSNPSLVLTERLAGADLRSRALEARGTMGDELEQRRWTKALESFLADVQDILGVAVDPATVTRGADRMPGALVDGLMIRRYGLAGLQVAVNCERCGASVNRVFTTLGNLGVHLAEPGLCSDCEAEESKRWRRAVQ